MGPKAVRDFRSFFLYNAPDPMRRKDLAKRLVSASTDAERRKLLHLNKKAADIGLARVIKDICYANWTTDPAIARKASSALRILRRSNASADIVAVSKWVDGIANITLGRFSKAIDDLDSSASGFRSIKMPVDAAQTQVARLIALALLGRYTEADRTGRAALRTFEDAGEDLAAGKIEMNLSNVAARRERHRDAEKYALSALRRFRKLGERTWQTMAENDLANTYSEINDFRRAEKYFAMAAESARAANMRVTEAEIEASMGNLELFRARYADALRLLELSRQKYDELQMPHQSAIADLEIGEIYTELNLLSEAHEILSTLVDRLKRLRIGAEEARGRLLLARVLSRLGDHSRSLKELDRARRLYEREENAVGIARAEILRAETELLLDRPENAKGAARAAIDLLRSTGNKRLAIAARWLAAEADRLSGRLSLARSALSRLIDESFAGEHLAIAVNALNSQGKVLLASGDRKGAVASFERAADTVEGLRAPIASDEFRMSFLAGRLEPWHQLFKLAIAEGDVARAFVMHEASRARSLSDAMTGRSGADATGGSLVKKLAGLREELNWFYSRLSREQTSEETVKLEREITKREREIGRLTRRVESMSPRSDHRRNMLRIEEIRSRLRNGTAFVEYVCVDGHFSAFVVTEAGIEFLDRLASEPEVRELIGGLRFQFETVRFGTSALKDFAAQLKVNADRYLDRLYQRIFSKVEPMIEGKRVVIAPAGVLNYIPFNALFDGDRYLIQKREVSVVPSASIWLSLRQAGRRRGGRTLLMAYGDKSIPLSTREVTALGRLFSDPTVATGRDATVSKFNDSGPGAKVIHLACHGQFRSDNPMFSSLHLADGRITVRDIGRRRLGADLVTLSACETGLSEIHPGEEILGLSRGFLAAGARNLIVSLWTVNDRSTSRLMKVLYSNLQRGLAPAASLRAAQVRSIDRGDHPNFWSPFILVGA